MSFLVRPLQLLLLPEGESDLNRLELVSLRNREELDSLRDNIEVVVSDRVSSDELVLARNSPPRKNPPAAGERGLNMAASSSFVGSMTGSEAVAWWLYLNLVVLLCSWVIAVRFSQVLLRSDR